MYCDATTRLSRPKSQQLLELWLSQQSADGTQATDVPHQRAVDPLQLGPWLGSLVLLDVLDGGRDFYFRLIGTLVVECVGENFQGRTLAQHQSAFEGQPDLISEYAQVVAGRRPTFDEQRWLTLDGGYSTLQIGRLCLPYRAEDQSISRLLVYFDGLK